MGRKWGPDVLNSTEWLLAYEVLVHGWHDNRIAVQLPSNADLFEEMRDSRVSFIEDSVLGRQTQLPQIFMNHVPRSEVSGREKPESDWMLSLLAEDTDEGVDRLDDPVDKISHPATSYFD